MPFSRSLRVLSSCAVALLAACTDATTSVQNVSTVASTPTPTPTPTATCAVVQTLAVGQVVTGLSGSSACISGVSTAAEYALVAYNGSTTGASSVSVSATGTSAPSAAADAVPTTTATLSSAASVAPSFRVSRSFETGLRIRERDALTPLIPSARRWMTSRLSAHAVYDRIPTSVTVGQLLRLNGNSSDACAAPKYRTARVVAVTNKAIVVADTANPAGGYTDAEYASVGNSFDTLVDPMDRQAFGDPSDIDGNGRVLIFFTKTVNDLTPATSSSYVGGFFFSRDLFPVTSTADYEACAGSNMGEMFYMMVPDPARGGAFTKANVTTEVTATIAHEYQHLINASRRMYVNTGAVDFEETWLDEGLAHIAEELLFYRVSGLSPRQNLSASTIGSSASAVAAFNNYASSNFGRYSAYLENPSSYSPYADNDSLATRGAAWAFLRYAADRRASTDGATWYGLVNSTSTGMDNMRSVFGANVADQIRDWGISVLSDDLTAASSQYQQQSWNFRSVFAALDGANGFPLSTLSLVSSPRTVALDRGANSYLRFSVAAGGTATVEWTSSASSVQFSLVRTK
ncbi:MAG: hypothetical protein V4550_00915 [Gemmatimonadota bacterium]